MEGMDAEDGPLNTGRVYPVSQFFGAAFLGGPLAGAYLVAENYRVLRQPMKAHITWLVAIIVTVFLFVLGAAIANGGHNSTGTLFRCFTALWVVRSCAVTRASSCRIT
jgi:D-alanyl-lipoteichoic acid acyltransferase DltB (MBOAT superfamily)